ncbi:MAG TPA: PQQ-binding-like beta-propeller repeat protein [Vicinamibacterales bacterium]|nr:PQQ-binding-like beta-propeller repeat protein [Vicinamibacterales bacterium]
MRRLLFIVAIAILPALGAAQDWNQWRGPARNGAAAAFKPPAAWPDRPKQIWKIQVGIGHSSPLAVGGRVYVFSRVGEQEAISVRDLASGKEIWRQAYDAPYQMNSAATSHGKGPKSTPVVDRGRVFTFGIAGTLSAWQAQDGKLIWRKDFKKEFPPTTPDYGVAMSPLVAGNLLVLHAGGANAGAVLALDPATGETKWAWKADGPAYASPVVATLAGTPQVITQSQSSLVSLSLGDGRLLWRIPFTTEYDQNAITPVVVGDLVVYSGLNKPAVAVRPTLSAGKWQAPEVWQNPDVPMYMSTAVESGGYLYGLTHRSRGQFFCIDARTGKTMWTTKGREAENAAFVTAGGLLMAMTTEGELVVMRANPKQFDLIKRYTIADSPVWAHPAPSGGGIVVKDEQSLAYWTF